MKLHPTAILVVSAGLLLAASSSTHAYEVPGIEAFFGASNIVATTGNGRLTAAVSAEGAISVLSWPSPTYFDHIQYVASNDLDARTQPRMGALEGMGIEAGVLIERASGERTLRWLTSSEWDTTVEYSSVVSTVVVTTYTGVDGVQVEQIDVVDDGRDVLYRDYTVTVPAEVDVASAWIVGYSNLSPSQTKLREMPIADFAIEQHQDFAAVWDEALGGIVHFHPADNGTIDSPLQLALKADNMRRDFGPLDGLLASSPTAEEVQGIASALDEDFAPGVYIAHASIPEPDQFQVGFDETDVCQQIDSLADNIAVQLDAGANPGFTIPSAVINILRCGTFQPLETPRKENGWTYTALDARLDAADGTLSGSRVAVAQVNTALRVPLELTDGVGRATLLYAFGETRAAAGDVLQQARAGAADARQRVEASDAAWASTLILPDVEEKYQAFLIRSLLSLRAGTDAQSGAIVASVSRQPSYHVDWPRDGVFFNVALDLAGKHALVEKRLQFYADTIRTEPSRATTIINVPPPGWPQDENADEFPAGSWEMNYYGDGVRSGNIRLEIDNTALVVWNFVQHAGWLDDEEARLAYLTRFWPTIEFAADWLAEWRDPETGLIWPSNEDDHIEYTQGMQGSATTFLALEAAAMAATALGHDAAAERYIARARELHSAILEHLWDGERLVSQPPWSELPVGRPTAWIGWPVKLLPADDPRLVREIRDGLERHVANVRGENPRGQYPTKVAISAALMFPGEPEADLAAEIAQTLAVEIATPDTQMLGEVFATQDDDGDGTFDRWMNLQGNPHLWSQVLVYITARAVHSPGDFDRYRRVLPEVDVRPSGPTEMEPTGSTDAGDAGAADSDVRAEPSLADSQLRGSGCQCSTTEGRTPGWFWLLGLLLWRKRRR